MFEEMTREDEWVDEGWMVWEDEERGISREVLSSRDIDSVAESDDLGQCLCEEGCE